MIGTLTFIIILPETKGVPLENMQELFRDPWTLTGACSKKNKKLEEVAIKNNQGYSTFENK